MSTWHNLCKGTIHRDLPEELQTLTIWCSIMIAAFLIAAIIGTAFWFRWFKLSQGSRATMWPVGRFAALLSLGCVFGAMSFFFYFFSLSNFYQMGYWPGNLKAQLFTNAQLAEMTERVAFHDYWWAGIVISHAFEQLFTTFADLLILERLSGKVLEETSVKERTRRLSHVLIVIFLILNVTNIGVMIACGAYNVRAGHEYLRSSAAYRRDDNFTGAELLSGANSYNDRANNIQGVGSSIEAIMIVSIVIVFVAVGLYVWRVLRRAQLLLHSISNRVKGDYNVAVAKSAIEAGSAMQKRVEGTVVVVFMFFVLRAIYASMFAASFVFYDLNPNCAECEDCQSTLTVMGVWFIANPGFHAISNLLSAPVALLLAMFGIFLPKQELQLLLNRPSKDDHSMEAISAIPPNALL